jgi:hypothetical protein
MKVKKMNIGIKSFLITIFLTLFAIISPFAYSQDAALIPNAVQQFFDNNGNPLSSGKVYFYEPGTDVLKTTWKDNAKAVANTNPIILNAAGRAIVYGDGLYRQVLKDKNNNLIWDAITAPGGGGSSPTNVGDGNAVGTIKPWAGLLVPNQYLLAYGQEISREDYSDFFNTITLNTNVSCSTSNNIITGLSDTSQISIGSKVELTCIVAGTTVVSKTSSTVTLSNPSSISLNTLARFFPYGNGNGSTTFNVPDLRDMTLVGRPNMGGSDRGLLTSTYYGSDPNGLNAVGGSQSNTLIVSNLPPYTPSGTINVDDPGHIHSYSHGTSGANAPGGAAWADLSSPVSLNTTSSFTGLNSSNVTFAGNAQGGASTPISKVQPSTTVNYIIKVLPDLPISTLNVVTSLGGMTGNITCGDGLICSSNDISAVATVTSVDAVGSNAAITITGGPITSSGTLNIGCNIFTSSNPGCVSNSGGGISNYLRADGTWAVPPGTGGGGGLPTIANGHVIANATGSTATAGDTTVAALFDAACSSIIGQAWVKATGGWGCLSLGYANPVWWGADPTGVALSDSAIASAIASGVGVVQFPLGTFDVASAIAVNVSGMRISGVSEYATVLRTRSTTADTIFVTASGVTIERLNFHTTQTTTKTAGAYVRFYGANDVTLQHFRCEYFFNCILIDGPVTSKTHVYDGYALGGATSGAEAVRIAQTTGEGASVDLVFRDVFVNGSGASRSFGIYGCGDCTFDHIETLGGPEGVLIAPPIGKSVLQLSIVNSYFDTHSDNGINIAMVGGNITNIKLTNNWAGSNQHNGIVIQGGSGTMGVVEIVSCTCINNGFSGIADIATIPHRVRVLGGVMAANLGSAAVAFGSGVSNFSVQGAYIGPFGIFAANTTGIALLGGNDNFVISGNSVVGNTTSIYIASYSGTSGKIVDNVGYNPVGGGTGGSVVTTTGSCPYTYTAGASPETAYIGTSNGGFSGLSQNGNNIAAFGIPVNTQTTLQLGPGETFTASGCGASSVVHTRFIH